MNVDYTDYSAVCAYADSLGKGNLVVKYDDIPNFNIVHRSRRDLWDVEGCKVKFSTGT